MESDEKEWKEQGRKVVGEREWEGERKNQIKIKIKEPITTFSSKVPSRKRIHSLGKTLKEKELRGNDVHLTSRKLIVTYLTTSISNKAVHIIQILAVDSHESLLTKRRI